MAIRIGDEVKVSWGTAVVIGLTRGGEIILRDSTGYVFTTTSEKVLTQEPAA